MIFITALAEHILMAQMGTLGTTETGKSTQYDVVEKTGTDSNGCSIDTPE